MRKASISDPGCAWDCPHYTGDIEYAADMCPHTLDILSCTVGVSTNPFWEPAEINALTDKLVEAARAL